jgi:uncharacterized phage protein gp47/JayE
MAENLPQPQSYEDISGSMLSAYASKMGINDFNVGSAVTSFFETVALAIARSSGDIFQILKDFSVDRATGETLQRLARENKITPITAKPTTGLVTVTDTSFNKISTKVYAGANPPNIGSVQIKVSDASLFTPTGSVYIGRGTPNIEGPIPYSSVVQLGSYYVVNLSNPTTKFHNVGETVILAQGGNRNIPANTIAISPSSGATPDLQYSVVTSAIILDGEVESSNIQVSALLPGASGRIPRGAIKEFASAPFPGASVRNDLPFTTGSDSETDDQLRVRIKRSLSSIGLGTATAIKSKVIGATPTDEQSSIVSTDITTINGLSTVYVDDGNVYEAKSTGIGLEVLVDSALGGEYIFQISTGGRQAPVAKAFLETTLSAPFDLIGGDTLAVTVGDQTYQHIFSDSDFRSPGGVTAFEVTASVNANTALGFEATTANGGQNVVIRKKGEGNDTIKISTPTTSGRDAAIQLGFPANEIQTVRLYKNRIPLSQFGNSASIFSQSQQLWSATIANGETLILTIDNTAPITYTILDADFINTGLYTSVSSTNSLDSWVQVLNNKLTGATVEQIGSQLKITSNLGANNRAQISIDPSSSLVVKGMFSSLLGLSSSGKSADFILDRNTAQIQLISPLSTGDRLELGSDQTEARISSEQIPSGSITFASDAYVWILVDEPGQLISTGVSGSSILGVSKPSTNVIRYTSNIVNAFANIQIGDYVIIWSNELPSSDRLEGRVRAVTASTLDLLVTASEYASAAVTPGVLFSEGFIVLRSILAPQKFKIASGVKTLDQIALELQAQTNNINFSVSDSQYLILRSTSKDIDGRILIVTSDSQGKLLGLTSGDQGTSKDSLIAFYDSQEKEGQFPLFIHSNFSSGVFADPINSFISSLNSSISFTGRDPNELISILHPYGSFKDAQPYGESVQEKSISGFLVNIENDNYFRRLRSIDRFFIASPLDFGHNDTSVVVMDNDTNSKSFELPLYRIGQTNTTLAVNPSNFNAYDVDFGPTSNFSDAFGATFDFSNFKVLMQAHKVLKPSPTKTALLFRSTEWGRSGEKINIGYVYPSVPNSDIGSTVVVDDQISIRINLKSDIAVATSIDATTEWDITIVPNTPVLGVDQVTYTWNGIGTNPALTGLVGGEYVNMTSQTEFDPSNIGIFRVSTEVGFTPTSTSFTIQRPNGAAIAESNKSTLVSGSISFYQASNTTASDINDYINNNLSLYFTSTIVNDGGIDGSGIVNLSTFEDSNFVYDSVYLLDGINWISSNNFAGSPQFTFKVPLSLSTDVGYAFNDGEYFRLIPTTMDQVYRLWSILAVTGLTTVGSLSLVDRNSKLEISTNILGSDGSVQIIGGLGNKYEVPVLDTASRINNSVMQISSDRVSSQGIHSDQWFKLQSSNYQRKEALFSSNTSIDVIGDYPLVGKSTIVFKNKADNQRYFGKPRHHIRSSTRTFKIEKQGSLVCLSWDGSGISPNFIKSTLNLDDSLGGTLNIEKISGSNDSRYIILTGNTNFNELSIGDLLTIAGTNYTENNGTFLVTGVSDDGTSVRVLNPSAKNQFSSGTFTFTANANIGDAFTIDTTTLIADTDFAIGVTPADTAINFSAVAGTIAGVTSSVNGTIVTITASSSASIGISYVPNGPANVTVSGAFLVGQTFVSDDFSAYSEVSEGDTLILSSPFSVLNQGRFRVIRRYGDSVWFENSNVMEEEVTLPYNNISLGVDPSTSIKVNATNNSAYLNWNGIGTEPNFENAKMGDVITFGTDFDPNNQGEYMVLRSGAKLQEKTNLVLPAGSQFILGGAGKYFFINSAGDVNLYYVWFNVNGSNSDPSVPLHTGVQVNILSGDNDSQVAFKVAAVLNVTTGLSATSIGNTCYVTTVGYQETSDATNFNVPSPFSVLVIQQGRRTFLECINPSAVNETAVFISMGAFSCHRPQIQFVEYESSVIGDKLVVTGDTLSVINAGTFNISEIIDVNSIVIDSTLLSMSNVSLNNRESSVYVEEGVLYSGYKHVLLVSSQPGAPTRNLIDFDTVAQYTKINESAKVQLTSLNKLNYSTVVKNGLDSYRYNTGLIAEANRIIYGDPRDPVTYPGVGAAGSTVFVREPLVRRVQISIDCRFNTGVPFAQAAEQVRTSVSSLINSNDVGSSIAISSIIGVVNSIPGVRAVAISSPLYDATHDLIFLAPGEKSRIIDPIQDISVSAIG